MSEHEERTPIDTHDRKTTVPFYDSLPACPGRGLLLIAWAELNLERGCSDRNVSPFHKDLRSRPSGVCG